MSDPAPTADPAAPEPAPRSRRGRPTDYDSDFHNERAFRLSLLGMTDAEMAHHFCVSEQTFNAWKERHPEFLEAIQNGKEDADGKVADSLYQRARGYSHPAVKIYADPKTGQVVEVPYTEHYPPDTAAAFIWLKNRQSGKWRDRQHVVVEDPDKVLARVLGVEPEALPEPAQVMDESTKGELVNEAGGSVDLDLDKHQG